MHTLFTTRTPPAATVTTPARFDMTKRRLRKNLIDVIRHNRKSSYAVRSNHLLVKILTSLNLDINLPIFEYHRLAENRAERVANAHRLTTSKRRGDVETDALFYGEGTDEIVIYVNEDIDLLSIEHDWRSLQPVKVLAHPYTDLSHVPLTGDRVGKYNAFATVQVDIVALALQYRQWVREQLDRGSVIIRTPMQFVSQYPLTNALASHHDVAIQNRLIAHYFGNEVDEETNPWPIYLKDQTREVDDYLFDRIRYLSRRDLRFDTIMLSVPVAVADSLWELNRLPKMAITRQNEWALNLTRAPIIEFMVRLDYDLGGQRNRAANNRIGRSIRSMEYDRDMMVALPPGRYDEVLDWFKNHIGAYL